MLNLNFVPCILPVKFVKFEKHRKYVPFILYLIFIYSNIGKKISYLISMYKYSVCSMVVQWLVLSESLHVLPVPSTIRTHPR